MRVDLFDFDLPEDNIALRPANPRDSAKLLSVKPDGTLDDLVVRDLPSLLQPGDALVFNDTRVIPAQLEGWRIRGENRSRISATLHMRAGPDTWLAFVRPAKRVSEGDRLSFGDDNPACDQGSLLATAGPRGNRGEFELRFDLSGPALDQAIMTAGHIPLPPYIASKRAEDERDRHDVREHLERVRVDEQLREEVVRKGELEEEREPGASEHREDGAREDGADAAEE